MVVQTEKCVHFGAYFNQILLTILINIPIISFGLVMGWMSPSALLLQSPGTPSGTPLSDEVISWMASVTFLSALPAVFLYGYIADFCGRKPAIMWTSAAFAACWMLKLVSSEPWAFITARAIAGFGSSGSFIVIPLYVKEISEDTIRGALGSVMILGQNLGYLIMYILGDCVEYRTILWGCLALSLLHMAVFVFVPESPAFLALRNRKEEASSALCWLRQRRANDKQVLEELELLSKEADEDRTTVNTLKFLVTEPIKLKAFIIVLIVVLAQEMSGVFTLLMYAALIFERAAESSPTLSPNQQTMMLGAVQLLGSILALWLVEKFGRKRLLAGTSYAVGLCTLTVALWFWMLHVGTRLPGWIPLAAMCLGMLCDAAGMQPVPYVIMSELFNFQYRGMVATATMGLCCLLNFMELKIFHPIVNSMGIHTVFLMYTVITLLFATYTIIFVPETMGKTVEEIYEDLKPKKKEFGRKFWKKRKSEGIKVNDFDSTLKTNGVNIDINTIFDGRSRSSVLNNGRSISEELNNGRRKSFEVNVSRDQNLKVHDRFGTLYETQSDISDTVVFSRL